MNKEDVLLFFIHPLSLHTHIHIYTLEYYLAIKKDEIMPFAATWMDLEIIILRDMISLICGI